LRTKLFSPSADKFYCITICSGIEKLVKTGGTFRTSAFQWQCTVVLFVAAGVAKPDSGLVAIRLSAATRALNHLDFESHASSSPSPKSDCTTTCLIVVSDNS